VQRPTGLSAAGLGRFALVALGFAFGLYYVLTSPYRHDALWLAWAPLLVALTTTAGAAFPYGLDRWAELGQLLNGHAVRVRDVASRVAPIAVVTLLIGVASTRSPVLHANWRGVALFAVSIIGGIPAAGAMEGVRHAARNSPASGTAGRQVTVLIRLRGLLQRLLAALGALVALWTFTFGAAILLQRHLEAGSAQGHVTVVPPQVVLISGGGGSLLVALFYVPAATALQRRGQNLCEELFPLHEAKEGSAILSLAEDRHKLEQLLGIDRGAVADLLTGLAILGPLLGSAAAAFLSPGSP
jgi:hypothetical protein